MIEKDCSKLSGWEAVKCIWEKYSALWIVPAFIMGITLGFSLGYSIQQDFDFLESMIPEITGIGLTVGGIYYLERWRQDKLEEKRLKKQLIREAGSQSNETAKSAIDWLHHKRWITGEGGLLKGAYLGQANLKGASLDIANFDGAYLVGANLEGASLMLADFGGANLAVATLDGANLLNANLKNANLQRAELKGASLHRANLEGAYLVEANLDGASLLKATLPDGTQQTPETDMSRFTDPEHLDFWQSPLSEWAITMLETHLVRETHEAQK